MIEQQGTAIKFVFFFTESKVGKTGLTVTTDVYDEAGVKIVTDGAATEIGGGLYSYTLVAGSVDAEGVYLGIGKTATATVDAQHVPSAWAVGVGGVENLDATVASRLATAGYTTPPTAPAIADEVRTELATELARVDVAVSTRLADADYTDPPTPAAIADEVRVELATELGRIDVDISSRLAAAGYTAPDNAGITAIGTDVDELGTRLTAARAALLDNLDAAVSTRSTFDPEADEVQLSVAAYAAIADKLLDRSIAGGADGGRTVKQALAVSRNKVVISGNTMYVYDTDDTTVLFTAALTTAARNPISIVDPT